LILLGVYLIVMRSGLLPSGRSNETDSEPTENTLEE
jgi:hypothetical protein